MGRRRLVGGPTRAELAEIEAEWPVISAEIAVTSAEIEVISAGVGVRRSPVLGRARVARARADLRAAERRLCEAWSAQARTGVAA